MVEKTAVEPDNWPHKRCEMPEITEGEQEIFTLQLLHIFFNRGGPSDYAAAAYSRNFVRLSDQAIKEYCLARESLIKYATTPNEVMSPFFDAIGHMEQCIYGLRRAIRFARHKKGPRLPKMDVISSAVESRIRKMRDKIEHTDELVRKGIIQPGDLMMLAMKIDHLELGKQRIYYKELADWLKQLRQLAEFVATYREGDIAT